jgi:hypothetical protein
METSRMDTRRKIHLTVKIILKNNHLKSLEIVLKQIQWIKKYLFKNIY